MKHILLMRHAKSSWGDPGLKDFDRPLSDRGRRDAPSMGKFILKAGYKPGLVIASPALRARQTTELVTDTAGLDNSIIYWNESMYYGTSDDYLSSVKECDDDVECVLLVGHNPLMEETVSRLCSDAGDAMVKMPTAALVCLENEGESWKHVNPGTSHMKWMVIPRILN